MKTNQVPVQRLSPINVAVSYSGICSILILICCLLFSNDIFGQEDFSSLKKLEGFSQVYYASKGSEARVNEIATRTDNASKYYHELFNFKPETELFILAPADWSLAAAKPLLNVYGFPHNVTEKRLVVATEDNDFWRSFTPPVSQLSPAMAARVKQAYGKNDGGISMQPFFDLLAIHELGHPFHQQGGLKMQRHWMGELFVNLMLHTYVAEKEPALLPALEAFPEMVVGAGDSQYKFTSLADFERLYTTLGMGPKNYGWYQAQLHHAAKQIYNAGGKSVVQRLWTSLKNHQEQMSDDDFVAMLKKEVHPTLANVYQKWNLPGQWVTGKN